MQPENELKARVPHYPDKLSWTRDNDKAIIKHIINVEAFLSIEDETMWRMMEQEMVVVGRSAVEMKDRFASHILWNLNRYTNKFEENKFTHAKQVFLGKHKLIRSDEPQVDDVIVKKNGCPEPPLQKIPKLENTEKNKRNSYIHVENETSIALDDSGFKNSFQKPDRDKETYKVANSCIDLEARETSSKKHSCCYKKECGDLEDNTNAIKSIDEHILPTIIEICKGVEDLSTTKNQSIAVNSKREKNESNWQTQQILVADSYQNDGTDKMHGVFTEVRTTAVTSTNRSEKAFSPTSCLARVNEVSSSIYEAAKPENTIVSSREETAVKFVRNIARQIESPNANAKKLAEVALMDLAQKYNHMRLILNGE